VQEKPFIHFAGNSDIYLFILPQCQILAPKKTLNLMLYSNLKICTQVQKSNNEERTSFASQVLYADNRFNPTMDKKKVS
jgi:hypothetical protein